MVTGCVAISQRKDKRGDIKVGSIRNIFTGKVAWNSYLTHGLRHNCVIDQSATENKVIHTLIKNQLSRQTGSRNLTGPKTLPTIWYTYMMLVTKYQIYPIPWEAFFDPPDSYFLFAKERGYHRWTLAHSSSIVAEKNVTKNVHICSMCIETNWVGKQEVGIWRVQKRFPQSIDDRDLIFGHKLHIGTPYRGKRFWTHRIPTSCLPTCAYMFNVYKNQLSRQTGSRNLIGPKTLPTIWGTYFYLSPSVRPRYFSQ
jgi:hypothetical protein